MTTKETFEHDKFNNIFKLLNSPEELRDWVYLYFDLYMPMGHVEDISNSSSVGSMWEIYEAVKNNTGDVIPAYTILSARDAYKTLSSAILEVLLLVHFRTTIAHCSAILSQSAKSIEYCESFINKIKPYLIEHGWKQTGSSKRKIELTTDKGNKCYIQIIVLTVKGANSSHTRLMFIDEVDLCDPGAYEEAKMIPGVAKGKFPITVRLSTRKYSFGLMEKAIKDAPKKNEKVLRWNIIDVAEYCPDSRCLPTEPTVKRMIPRTLPLQQLSLEDFEDIDESLRSEWEEIDAYAGCLKCPLLSVCKKQLHDKRTPDQVGDLWKPIPAVITSIRGVEPDTGEAQLRCNKPSTKGLVFPRFTDDNIVTLEEAWEMVHGDPYDNKGDKENTLTLEKFINYLHELGVPLCAGMDYGYTANHAMIVGALLTSDEFLVLDSYSMPGLELDDIKKLCTEWQEKYRITAWFPDTAYPSYNKTLGKIIPIKKFEKDTAASISAIQTIIVNSGNVRRLKIIRTLNNMSIIDGIGVYHWKLHPATKEPTDVLDDTGEEADIIDAFRYLCQNLFSKVKNGISFSNSSTNKVIVSKKNLSREELVEEANKMIMYGSVKKAAVNDTFNPPKAENAEEKKEGHGKKIIWKF